MSPAHLALATPPAAPGEDGFQALVEQVRALGRDVIAPAADAVDRDARFPEEAFAALRELRLLSAYVPAEYGGMGLELAQVSRLCEVLGESCANAAMIFAMHQIQVACIVHHGLGSAFFRDYAREIATHQRLLASATTELGIGGDVRRSKCAVRVVDDHFILEKQCPVISYGEAADAILVTCRSSEEAGPNDQSLVLVRKEDCLMRRLSEWDTLGFRGTCSPGFELKSIGRAEQVLPVPYAAIHGRTQHPVAHLLWASLWVGLGVDALARARTAVKAEARRSPGATPISATRLAEADLVLGQMKCAVRATLDEYRRVLAEAGARVLDRGQQPQAHLLAAGGRGRREGDADLRHRGLPQRLPAHARPAPARRDGRRAHGQQRPHPGPERPDARRLEGGLTPCAGTILRMANTARSSSPRAC